MQRPRRIGQGRLRRVRRSQGQLITIPCGTHSDDIPLYGVIEYTRAFTSGPKFLLEELLDALPPLYRALRLLKSDKSMSRSRK